MARKSSASNSGTDNRGGANSAPVVTRDDSVTYNLPIFQYLACPKSTAIANAVKFTLRSPVGVVRRVWVEMPRGCAGLVGIKVKRGPYQVFPLPDGTWYKSDGTTLPFNTSIVIDTNPFDLDIYIYNLDEIYSHTPWIAFEFTNVPAKLPAGFESFIKALGDA